MHIRQLCHVSGDFCPNALCAVGAQVDLVIAAPWPSTRALGTTGATALTRIEDLDNVGNVLTVNEYWFM